MPKSPEWMPTEDPMTALGMKNRATVLGDAHVERSLGAAQGNPRRQKLQKAVTQLAWGSIWGRPGLDLKSRSLVTMSVLLALGHHEEFALHLRGARRNGWTQEELSEAILQIACYAGWPAAMQGYKIAEDVFAAEEEAAPAPK